MAEPSMSLAGRRRVLSVMALAIVVAIAIFGVVFHVVSAVPGALADARRSGVGTAPSPAVFHVLPVVCLAASLILLGAKTRAFSDAYGALDPTRLPTPITLQTNVILALALAEGGAILTLLRAIAFREPPQVYWYYAGPAIAVILLYILPKGLTCLSRYRPAEP